MLRIDMRPGDKVMIGDDVEVTLEYKSGQVARIAFKAGPATRIRRLNGALPGVPTRPA